MTDQRPIRILHIVGGMNRGGVETWLMHVLRHIDRERYQMDFLVHTLEPCAYDDEIRALGSRIIACPHPHRPWRFAPQFLRILREHGPYDIVHSHVHHYSGFTLWLAKQAGVPMRIAHSHNDTTTGDRAAGLMRKFYLRMMEQAIRRAATHGLACSHRAAAALYGRQWQRDPRWQVLYYGIDLAPFREALSADSATVRAELGLPPEALVIGHVGRFAPQKNHEFLIDIFAEIARREPRAHLLLVGDGPLRGSIEAKVRALGLQERVTFTGLRADVPRLMAAAMDLFVFPSIYEGLGLVLVEAQAAGLPCVLSDVIPHEADVVPALIHRLALQADAATWAERVLAVAVQRPLSAAEALATVEASPFAIQQSVSRLEAVYGR